MAPIYRLLISSTINEHLVSVRQIRARDIMWAEQRAIEILRRVRLSSVEGLAWDRWDIGSKSSLTGKWTPVARGTAEGTTWTVRDTLDKLRGHGTA